MTRDERQSEGAERQRLGASCTSPVAPEGLPSAFGLRPAPTRSGSSSSEFTDEKSAFDVSPSCFMGAKPYKTGLSECDIATPRTNNEVLPTTISSAKSIFGIKTYF